jgi:C4-dicarboxylate-binding protein DctP
MRRVKGSERVILVAVTIGAVVLALVAGAYAQQPLKARLSYHWFPKHHAAVYADKFAQECRKATNGKLEVEVFHSGQLFDIRQALSAVSSGGVELAAVLDLNFEPVNKNFQLSSMAYFWDSYQRLRDFWTKTPEGSKEWEGLQKKLGIKILCYDPVGPSCLFSTKDQLGAVDRLKGLKSRYLSVSEKPGIEAMGMSGVSVGTAEVYTALKQGMIDTLTSVPSAVGAYSWWDFLKYVQQPYMAYNDAHIVANARWWDGLPNDVRDVILNQVAPRISKEATDSIVASSDDSLKEMAEKHGGKVVTLPPGELKKLKEIYRTQVWPALGAQMDKGVYEAAKRFANVE